MAIARRLAAATAIAALGVTAFTGASTAAPKSPRLAIEHVAFLKTNGQLYEVDVQGRSVSAPRLISGAATGVATAAAPFFIEASPDGKWLAWAQAKNKSSSNSQAQLVLYDTMTGGYYVINTDKDPIGFAGDTLLASFNKDYRVVLTPKVHFVVIPHDKGFGVTGYPGGDINFSLSKNTKDGNLQLINFAGHVKNLHHYTDFGPPDYRTPGNAAVSADGIHFVVERGDHQDFGGLGPSSVSDEFNLKTDKRIQLGHYVTSSTTKLAWRVANFAFGGPKDTVYACWEALKQHGVDTVVAVRSGGTWNLVRNNSIAVAADPAGDVIVQPGYWKFDSSGAGNYNAKPSSAAILEQGNSHTTLTGVKGTQLFLVAG